MSETDIPTVIATAAAATEFLILWIPSKGILIFLIIIFFLFGRFTCKSNSENFILRLIFLIKKFDFEFTP